MLSALTPAQRDELAAMSTADRAVAMEWLVDRARVAAEFTALLASARQKIGETNRQMQEWVDSASSSAWREVLSKPLASGLMADEALRLAGEGGSAEDVWTVENIVGGDG